MRAVRTLLCAVLAAGAAGGLAACGDDDGGKAKTSTAAAVPKVPDSPRPPRLAVYISAAQTGGSSPSGLSITNGATLALEQHDGQAAGYPVSLVVLNDTDEQSGATSAALAAGNAAAAADDDQTIAYIGDQSSTATAAAAPILNRAGILQVSPNNTYDGLTRAGVQPGEPQKYFPTGKRTFARVVPRDQLQARAQAEWQRQLGCTTLMVADDGGLYGRGLAAQVATAAKAAGMTVSTRSVDLAKTQPAQAAASITGAGASCMFMGASVSDAMITLWKFLYANAPNMKLFGGDALTQTSFTGEIGASEKSTYLTAATVSPKLYNDQARDFYDSYQTRFGGSPEASGIYGYEAMDALLDSIDRLGDAGNDRAKVIESFFSIRNRASVLGTYSLDANGDTTLGRFGAYRVDEGVPVFDHVITATSAAPSGQDAAR